jgi:hypothetical protein
MPVSATEDETVEGQGAEIEEAGGEAGGHLVAERHHEQEDDRREEDEGGGLDREVQAPVGGALAELVGGEGEPIEEEDQGDAVGRNLVDVERPAGRAELRHERGEHDDDDERKQEAVEGEPSNLHRKTSNGRKAGGDRSTRGGAARRRRGGSGR